MNDTFLPATLQPLVSEIGAVLLASPIRDAVSLELSATVRGVGFDSPQPTISTLRSLSEVEGNKETGSKT